MLQIYSKSSDAVAFLHFSLSHLLIIFEIPILLRYWNARAYALDVKQLQAILVADV